MKIDSFAIASIRYIDTLVENLEREGHIDTRGANNRGYVTVDVCIEQNWEEWLEFDDNNSLDLEFNDSIKSFWRPILMNRFPSERYARIKDKGEGFASFYERKKAGFFKHICDAITMADMENMKDLYKGFPELVEGYIAYTYGKEYSEWVR